VWFGFFGGNRCLGPIYLQLRAPGAELRIGRGVWLMPATQIVCFDRITIGPEAMFGFGCSLIDSDVHDFSSAGEDRPGKSAPIKIGQRASVCPETTILKGVSVGDYAVVGNKSVVQGNLPARCVAAGNPARVFLQYKDPEPASPKEKALA
jgi:galactoside O-acetyltransferase